MNDNINIIVVGVGGQGNVVAARLIGDAAIEAGYHVAMGETHGAGQRGGAVSSHVRLWKKVSCGPLIPEADADAVIGLEPFEALKCATKFLKPNGIVVTNECPVMPSDRNYLEINKIFDLLKKIPAKVFSLDGTSLAKEVGDVASLNIVMIGAVYGAGVLPIEEKYLKNAIKNRLSKTVDLNFKAFAAGKNAVKK